MSLIQIRAVESYVKNRGGSPIELHRRRQVNKSTNLNRNHTNISDAHPVQLQNGAYRLNPRLVFEFLMDQVAHFFMWTGTFPWLLGWTGAIRLLVTPGRCQLNNMRMINEYFTTARRRHFSGQRDPFSARHTRVGTHAANLGLEQRKTGFNERFAHTEPPHRR